MVWNISRSLCLCRMSVEEYADVYQEREGDNKKIDNNVQLEHNVLEANLDTNNLVKKPVWLCVRGKNDVITNNALRLTPSVSVSVEATPCLQSSPSLCVNTWPKLPTTCRQPYRQNKSFGNEKQCQSRSLVNKSCGMKAFEQKTSNLVVEECNITDSVICHDSKYDGWENKYLVANISNEVENISSISQLDKNGSSCVCNENPVSYKDTGDNKLEKVNDKLIMKLKKLQLKEEKRREKEEEKRRKMIAPKSQHLKTISHSEKDAIMAAAFEKNSNKIVDSNKSDNNFELHHHISEFPDLGASSSRQKKNNSYSKNFFKQSEKQDSLTLLKEPIKDGKGEKEKLNNDIIFNSITLKEGLKKIHTGATINEKNKNTAKKKVKKNDPIEFSIASLLEISEKKPKQTMKSQATKKLIKKKRLLSGNELDSDRPLRKRGKFRENEGKKATRIKRLILNERQKRMQFRNEAKLKLLNIKRLVLDVTSDYSNLVCFRSKTKQLNDCATNVNVTSTVECLVDYKNDDTIDNGSDFQRNIFDKIDPKSLIHSRKFKFYCDQWPTDEMNNYVRNLIKTIVRFQDRHHDNDPIKAHAKRRYVCGFHEVLRYLNVCKTTLVIIATDIECRSPEDILFDSISQVIKSSESSATPYVYCGSRWSLKSWFRKKSCISCAAILNYNGAEEFYKNIICTLPKVKNLYDQKLKEAEMKCGITHQQEEDVTSLCIKSVLNALAVNDSINSSFNNNIQRNERIRFNDRNEDNYDNESEEDESEASPLMAAIIKSSKRKCDIQS